MKHISVLHEEFMKDPEYRAEYERLEPEFVRLKARLKARPLSPRCGGDKSKQSGDIVKAKHMAKDERP